VIAKDTTPLSCGEEVNKKRMNLTQQRSERMTVSFERNGSVPVTKSGSQ
jgi:hypothetical protein